MATQLSYLWVTLQECNLGADIQPSAQNNLALGDNPASNDTSQPEIPGPPHRPRRPENVPPAKKFGPSLHQASRSHEEEQRRLRHGGKPQNPETIDIFADPPNTSRFRRPRRNSDSSLVDKGPELTDEERRARWKRLTDKEQRQRLEAYRAGVPPPAIGAAKVLKPSKRLDIIDQLDVTSIYGTGCKWNLRPQDSNSLHWQWSITTAPLMPAILIETARVLRKHPCRPSLKTLPTTPLGVLAP